MIVIAGLGNPTSKYKGTRHNVGFEVIDMLADRYNIRVKDKKHQALCGTGLIEGQKVLLVKPQTFMNLSGESIGAILNFYKLEPQSQLIVVYDDVSLEPGRLRIRMKGSAGGHNGVKSVISHAKTQEFQRVKVGVGEKPQDWDLADYVLRCPPRKERILLKEAFDHACTAIGLMVQGKTEQAMNQFN
ncbi:MAG: aminoacyl-tRNA hydrolase [Lachnospiraceae bacterium]|jgi:peptidyl-tRNA hydrolase|nr:aminoacyl-tRNA hydrolase [Lachnospiraceae bacterium]